MPTYFARKTGNINAADVWATTPAGTASAVTFADGDVLMANSFTITVNVSVNLGATGQVRTDTTGGATAGGGFTLNNGVTLTANVFAGTTIACTLSSGSATITGNCISGIGFQAYSAYNIGTGTLTINGNVTAGSGDTANGAQNQNAGTLTINGNVSASGSSSNGSGAVNNAGGIINITGNVLGAGFGGRGVVNFSFGRINISGNVTGGSNASNAHGAVNSSTGRIVITNGTVTGGSNAAAYGAHNASTGVIEITGVVNGASSGAPGVRNEAGGQILLTGTATGGSNSAGYGVHNFGTGIVTITGLAAGGAAAVGARNEAAGIINLTRAVGNGFGFGSVGLSAAAGVTNVSVTGEIGLQEIEYGVLGMTPTSGSRIKLVPASSNVAKFNFTTTAVQKTLADASATGDMPAASNVRNGTAYAAGTVVGTLVIPPASSVAFGVPVDATTGTAVLTLANVQSALTAQGLTTARAGNLDNLDASVSSRLAPSGTLATVTTLTNAPSVPTPSAIASQVRTELSVELARVDQNISSRLAAADYTAPSAAPTVVAIRQEMDSNSTKLANLDASISSRLATSGYTAPTSAPSVADIRTELAVELGRLDASVSSRLAGSSYTAPTTPPTAAEITTAVWAAADKTGYSLTSAERTAIAAAVESSILNEADGQAVLNALVGAIGNTNLSEVSLVAAVRADLERTGGKLDNIPTTSAPSASAVAGAVRTELGVELGRLDASVSSRLAPSGTLATVTNLTNAPASVTPSDIWSHSSRTLTSASGPTAVQIRQEIDANSTKLDAAISSRMAASEVTKLDAVKAKTDALNTDRLANVATTNIVGTLLAQSQS